MEVIREQEGVVTDIFRAPEIVFAEDKPRDNTGELIIIQDASVSEVMYIENCYFCLISNLMQYTTNIIGGGCSS